MKFEKYQHIERLGSSEVDGILNGEVYIFSKIDGTNAGVYLNDCGEVEVNSRNKVLTDEMDNAGCCKYVKSLDMFEKYLEHHPNHRLFGEWLVPHSIKGYKDDSWRKLYIFDVIEYDSEGNGHYLSYEEYVPLLEEWSIPYIPLIAKLTNPTEENVKSFLDRCDFLMKDNKAGEGIVIKNYGFINNYGRVTWAKVVRSIVKESQKTSKQLDINTEDVVEDLIVSKFLTPELVSKEKSKIELENGGWESKLINKLLGVVWHTFITEEMFEILRKFKNPKIDFALLKRLVTSKVKEFEPNIFR